MTLGLTTQEKQQKRRIMLNVVMLSIVMLNVVAPFVRHQDFFCFRQSFYKNERKRILGKILLKLPEGGFRPLW
jgi:hypothetical protein